MLSRGSVKHVTVTLVEGSTCLNVRMSAKVSVCTNVVAIGFNGIMEEVSRVLFVFGERCTIRL